MVVIAYPGDDTFADLEKRATGQYIALSAGRRQALIGPQIPGMDHLFGGGMASIGAGHPHDIMQLLAIVVRHALQERGKAGAADLSRCLVQILDQLPAQTRQPAVPVSAVESVNTTQQDNGRLLCR